MKYSAKDKIEMIKRFDLLSGQHKNEMYNIEEMKKICQALDTLVGGDAEEAIKQIMDIMVETK